MTSDHLAITPDVQERYPAPFYEPFTTLGWLAGVTQRIEIGLLTLQGFHARHIGRQSAEEQ
jgi:alkanesulfonate monooxygenase SsuD/methylene tetrahydromethanopterin reductase-like flavin-dependent oxidoreductase (luciferase family)